MLLLECKYSVVIKNNSITYYTQLILDYIISTTKNDERLQAIRYETNSIFLDIHCVVHSVLFTFLLSISN